VASLLGFDGILENSYDSVASRDFLAECSAAMAILMTTLSRLAEDLIIWGTSEFSVLDMPEEFSATSSIMPQKKNPFVLEHIKGRAGHVIAAVTSVLTVLKGTSFSHSREPGGEAPATVHNAFRLVQGSLEMLAHLFPQLSFDTELMERRANQGFSTVTELADLLVREKDISFRQAHDIIGRVVNELLSRSQGVEALSSTMIDQASREVIGHDLLLSEADVHKALDPLHNVEIRDISGGPAPGAMETLISHQDDALGKTKQWLSRRRQQLEQSKRASHEAQLRVVSTAT
jgi:argininosuccinate lyase